MCEGCRQPPVGASGHVAFPVGVAFACLAGDRVSKRRGLTWLSGSSPFKAQSLQQNTFFWEFWTPDILTAIGEQ